MLYINADYTWSIMVQNIICLWIVNGYIYGQPYTNFLYLMDMGNNIKKLEGISFLFLSQPYVEK